MSNNCYGASCAGVIKIDGRYFYGFGKGGRIKTAWSLGGARLYVYTADIDKDFEQVKRKYPKAVVGEVRLIAEQVAV